MTQADFGQLFGLHQTTIAHIETGRIDPLSHLADHLETSDMPAELSELTDGERLSVLRRRKGWEVKQVAEIAGIHPRYITMFEHDKKETPVEILALVMDLPLLP